MPRIVEEPGDACPNCGATDEARCEACGRWYCCVSYCDGCESCEHCCSCERSSSAIQDAGSQAYPSKRPWPPPYKPFLYLGVELEVECGDKDRDDTARAIKKAHGTDILLKDDGSLSNGFEMVSGPWSLDVHKQTWPNILKTAVETGARSWRKHSTGLHVHLSRNFFTPLAIGKLLVFLNSDQTKPRIVQLAGRESPDYAAMEKKRITDAFRRRYSYATCAETIVPTHAFGGSRYEILNLQNADTIEIRIFKGTLNLTHVLADIEFCHAAAYWIRDASMLECEDWERFWCYVKMNRKLYSNLLAFMGGLNRPTKEGEK